MRSQLERRKFRVPRYCPHCNLGNDVPLERLVVVSQDRHPTVPLLCEHCRSIYSADGFIGPNFDKNGEYFDPRIPATATDMQVTPAHSGRKPMYVTPRFDNFGRVASAIWRIEKRKQDIYVTSKAFPEFKISLHESGMDNLSWLKPVFGTGVLSSPNRDRHMVSFRREPAPQALMMAIFRIEVLSPRVSSSLWSKFEGNARKHRLLMLGPKFGKWHKPWVFRLEAHYTSSPLGKYRETAINATKLLKSYRTGEREWIHFFSMTSDEATPFRSKFPAEINKTASDRKHLGTLRFGVIGEGTILVQLDHN